MKKLKYLCTTALQDKLKRVRFHLVSGNPDKADTTLKRIMKHPMYPFNRQKLRKIHEEVSIGSPDKAEVLIAIFGY